MNKNEGGCYHLYNRGNNKGLIFFEEENYYYFLEQFKKYVYPYIEVYAYCLMPNHFHFFIKINEPEGFEKGIKNFFISYAKSINKRYNRVGSLFQGRYKISEVETDYYFTRIITYIHQNPVRANLVKNIYEYRFSSYRAYLTNNPTLLSKSVVLDWFGGLDEFVKCHQVIQTYEVFKTS